MSRAVIPAMRRPSHDATQEERKAAYLEYLAELARCNPGRFLPQGQRRRWWHLRLEHPLTNPGKGTL